MFLSCKTYSVFTAHARLMFRELVTIEDAVMAVTVMECSMQVRRQQKEKKIYIYVYIHQSFYILLCCCIYYVFLVAFICNH